MIEIFEPGSPEYSRMRAEQELGAAKAARLMKARAAHLDLAARHLSASRLAAGQARVPKIEDIASALRSAYQPADDEEGRKLLDLLSRS